MSDDGPDPDEIDLDEWPEALDAYRTAHRLAREARGIVSADCETASTIGAKHDAARELARLNSRLRLRGLAPAEEARVRAAIAWGEADGRSGVGPRW